MDDRPDWLPAPPPTIQRPLRSRLAEFGVRVASLVLGVLGILLLGAGALGLVALPQIDPRMIMNWMVYLAGEVLVGATMLAIAVVIRRKLRTWQP